MTRAIMRKPRARASFGPRNYTVFRLGWQPGRHDFNTGKHRVDEDGATFFSADCIDALEGAGWVDPWRSRNLLAREFTWFSHAGNGFRLDHACASPALAPCVSSAWHDQTPREAGVSDHAALVVDLA